ncbi:MAG TPA: ABC transporter permease [Candidatus Paceibacterota bacterium]|nr:ABC transporter permease [Candidatus Paceibacterota bacterium]
MRFKGAYLGLIWAGLEPLLIFLLLYTVFTSIRVGIEEDFGMYLLSGILIYHIFTRGTLSGMQSLRSNISILKSFKMEKESFPVSSTLTTAILSIIEVSVLIMLMPVFQFTPNLTIILLPISIGLLLLLILGFSYLLSIANVFMKDIQPIWAVVVQTLLFISPIFWYLKDVNELLLNIHLINPIGQLIEINHKIILLGEIPPLIDWLYTSAFVFGILFLGFAVFRKNQQKIIEAL